MISGREVIPVYGDWSISIYNVYKAKKIMKLILNMLRSVSTLSWQTEPNSSPSKWTASKLLICEIFVLITEPVLVPRYFRTIKCILCLVPCLDWGYHRRNVRYSLMTPEEIQNWWWCNFTWSSSSWVLQAAQVNRSQVRYPLRHW